MLGVRPIVSAQEGIVPKLREKIEITVPKEKFRLYLLIGQSNMATYKTKLIPLVAALRKEFRTPTVPFIVGEISHEVEKEIPYYAVVSAKCLTALPDGIHIDSESQRVFGKRYAEKMEMVNNAGNHK